MAKVLLRVEWVVLAILAVCATLAACGAPSTMSPGAKAHPEPRSPVLTSNVLRSDYAGSASCEPCHSDITNAWARAPMHRMTRIPKDTVIEAPFDGTTFHFKGDSATLESRDGERYVSVRSNRFGNETFRVSKVIGGRVREDFAGVRVTEIGAKGIPIGDSTEEWVLPVSYMKATKKLRYKGYSVMVKERPALHAGPVWNRTCIFCHNTVPYVSVLAGTLATKGTPPYQGQIVDRLLPEDRRWNAAIRDRSRFEHAVRDELAFLGARSENASPEGLVRATRENFRASHLVEIGIGCEACHGGSREHVASPEIHPSFTPTSPFLRVEKGGRGSRAEEINRACARCHQVLFSGYEFTWEGGTRRGSEPGGSNMNSGEARDLLLGDCKGELSCIDCHTVHPGKNAPSRSELLSVEGNRVCTKCHTTYTDAGVLAAHSHHAPRGEGSACLACHMPQKNMSLENGLSTYHRIGSPTDPKKVLLDRPLECALCHRDKSVASLVTAMETWWGKSYERASLEKLYGSLENNTLVSTLSRGKPHEQAVALSLVGVAKNSGALPEVTRHLTHPYPIVRFYAKSAVEAITGQAVDIDLDAEPSH